MWICRARCGASDLPYQSWLTLLQMLLAKEGLAGDERARASGTQALRELRAAGAGAQRDQRDTQEFRVFDSTALFVDYTIRARALLMLIEDVTAADLPSLRLLHFIARS